MDPTETCPSPSENQQKLALNGCSDSNLDLLFDQLFPNLKLHSLIFPWPTGSSGNKLYSGILSASEVDNSVYLSLWGTPLTLHLGIWSIVNIKIRLNADLNRNVGVQFSSIILNVGCLFPDKHVSVGSSSSSPRTSTWWVRRLWTCWTSCCATTTSRDWQQLRPCSTRISVSTTHTLSADQNHWERIK